MKTGASKGKGKAKGGIAKPSPDVAAWRQEQSRRAKERHKLEKEEALPTTAEGLPSSPTPKGIKRKAVRLHPPAQ